MSAGSGQCTGQWTAVCRRDEAILVCTADHRCPLAGEGLTGCSRVDGVWAALSSGIGSSGQLQALPQNLCTRWISCVPLHSRDVRLTTIYPTSNMSQVICMHGVCLGGHSWRSDATALDDDLAYATVPAPHAESCSAVHAQAETQARNNMVESIQMPDCMQHGQPWNAPTNL